MQINKWNVSQNKSLVLPLTDEDKPKCFVCCKQFENIEQLKNHQESSHKEIFEKHEKDDAKN